MKKNLVKEYAKADASGRVNLIYNNFAIFLGVIDSRTNGLVYLIENEKATNRRHENGELGVRVQKSTISDPTGNTATGNVMTRDALVACDFSNGVLEGTDRGELFKKEAFVLRDMRRDYQLFNDQLNNLSEEERQLVLSYIEKGKRLSDLAEELQLEYCSVRQRLYRSKRWLRDQMIDYMEGRV
jgi:hypothetical protein